MQFIPVPIPVGKPERIAQRPTNFEYIITLHEDIVDPAAFSEELEIINSAGPGDTVVVDICTNGGSLDTALLFRRALMGTPARTIAVIGPTCASAGTVIALSCSEWALDEYSSMMIHTSSYGIGGKDTDVLEHAVFSRKLLHKVLGSVYSGFMSEEELADVVKGTPFYFLGDELEERLVKLKEYQEKRVEDYLRSLDEVELDDGESEDEPEPEPKPKRKRSSRKPSKTED